MNFGKQEEVGKSRLSIKTKGDTYLRVSLSYSIISRIHQLFPPHIVYGNRWTYTIGQ